MYQKISVLVPTRGRVLRLQKLIESFDRMTDSGTAELVFRVDLDDMATRDYLEQHPGWQAHKRVIGYRGRGYSDLATFFNECAHVASGDMLMLGNDDMVFRTPGWSNALIALANGAYSKGPFCFGVHTHNEPNYPFATVPKLMIEKLGFLIDPRIYWADIYLRDVVLSINGQCRIVRDVHIDHEWAGFTPDRTFIEGDQNAIYQRDPHYWTRTHATAVKEAADKWLMSVSQ